MASGGEEVASHNVTIAETRVDAYLREVKDILECHYGLLDKLHEREILTVRDVAEIQESPNRFKQNDKLIEIMTPLLSVKLIYDHFMRSLRETCQSHIANVISGSPWNTNRPLTAAERRTIQQNSTYLKENLVLQSTLLDELLAGGVINIRHKEAIEAHRMTSEKIGEFLNIMVARSFDDFQQFLRCLRATGEEHILTALQNSGAVIAVNIDLNKEVEIEFIKKFEALPTDAARRQILNSLLKLLPEGTDFMNLKGAYSIRLYFLCHSLEALNALRNFFEFGTLIDAMESIMNKLLAGTPLVPVHLQHGYFVNYLECEDYFSKNTAVDDELHLDMKSLALSKKTEKSVMASQFEESTLIITTLMVSQLNAQCMDLREHLENLIKTREEIVSKLKEIADHVHNIMRSSSPLPSQPTVVERLLDWAGLGSTANIFSRGTSDRFSGLMSHETVGISTGFVGDAASARIGIESPLITGEMVKEDCQKVRSLMEKEQNECCKVSEMSDRLIRAKANFEKLLHSSEGSHSDAMFKDAHGSLSDSERVISAVDRMIVESLLDYAHPVLTGRVVEYVINETKDLFTDASSEIEDEIRQVIVKLETLLLRTRQLAATLRKSG